METLRSIRRGEGLGRREQLPLPAPPPLEQRVEARYGTFPYIGL